MSTRHSWWATGFVRTRQLWQRRNRDPFAVLHTRSALSQRRKWAWVQRDQYGSFSRLCTALRGLNFERWDHQGGRVPEAPIVESKLWDPWHGHAIGHIVLAVWSMFTHTWFNRHYSTQKQEHFNVCLKTIHETRLMRKTVASTSGILIKDSFFFVKRSSNEN